MITKPLQNSLVQYMKRENKDTRIFKATKGKMVKDK